MKVFRSAFVVANFGSVEKSRGRESVSTYLDDSDNVALYTGLAAKPQVHKQAQFRAEGPFYIKRTVGPCDVGAFFDRP